MLQIDDDVVKLAYDEYLANMRAELGREHKPVVLDGYGYDWCEVPASSRRFAWAWMNPRRSMPVR